MKGGRLSQNISLIEGWKLSQLILQDILQFILPMEESRAVTGYFASNFTSGRVWGYTRYFAGDFTKGQDGRVGLFYWGLSQDIIQVPLLMEE